KLMWDTIKLLETPLLQSVQGSEGPGWCTSSNLFNEEAPLKGAINISPTWFQQGRH
ncbi:hypothetical protein JVT61DRAFT_13597, partial [Boletus reticuloceps]